MINVNDFKTGMTIKVDGNLYQVVDFQHVINMYDINHNFVRTLPFIETIEDCDEKKSVRNGTADSDLSVVQP